MTFQLFQSAVNSEEVRMGWRWGEREEEERKRGKEAEER